MFDRRIHFTSVLAFALAAVLFGILLRFVVPVRNVFIAALIPPYRNTVEILASGADALRGVLHVPDEQDRAVLYGKIATLEAETAHQALLLEQFYSVAEGSMAVAARLIDPYADVSGHQATLTLVSQSTAQKGDAVVVGGILLGRIDRLGEGIATLNYTFGPLRETQGWLLGAKVPLRLEGKGGGFYHARVLGDVPIAPGDVVVDAVRRDIVIGEVVVIKRPSAEPFVEVLIRAPFILSHIADVLVIPYGR